MYIKIQVQGCFMKTFLFVNGEIYKQPKIHQSYWLTKFWDIY